MSSYIALYREWRPQRFSDIVGQVHITRTLQNAINSERIAHAYLFCGPRGTGKTTMAKVLAKALNCSHGPAKEPCNDCGNCMRITDGSSMDVMEIDAASNRGIDEIRDLREKVKFSPTEGRYRIYIIDEVHMLTTEAFNALLKTLEEPPKHVIFILATTEPHKIPSTILSRCQRFDFKRIGTLEIAGRLGEICEHLQIETDEETLSLLAKTAEGGLRDALSILDQCIAFGGQRVTLEEVNVVLGAVGQEILFKMADFFIEKDSTGALFLVDDIVNQGKDLRQFSKDLMEHFRNLLLIQVSPEAEELIVAPEHILNMLEHQARRMRRSEIVKLIEVFSETEKEIRWSNQPRLNLEVAIIEACSAVEENSIEGLLARIESLEKRLEGKEISFAPPASEIKLNKAKKQRASTNEEMKNIDDEIRIKKSQQPDVDFLKIQKLWPDIMEKIKGVKRTVHAFLIEAKVKELSETHLILGFLEEYAFHKENIEKAENKELIEKVLKDVCGGDIKVKCTFVSKEAETADNSSVSAGDPLVREAIQLFGDKVIEIND